MTLLRFLAAILSFGALYTKPSRSFVGSPRRIDNWIRGWCLHCWRTFSENRWICYHSFSEILQISEKYWYPLQHFLEDRQLRKKENFRTPDSVVHPSQRLNESLRRFGMKTHQYLNWLSKIEGISLKLKTRSGSYSGLDKSFQAKIKT